jgi:sulfonate transport system ATP-binding protein
VLLTLSSYVLVDGRLSLDVPIDLERPRWRGDPGFVALRDRLMAELGVEEPRGPAGRGGGGVEVGERPGP